MTRFPVESELKKESGSYCVVKCFMTVWKLLKDQPLLVIKDDFDEIKRKILTKFDDVSFQQKKGIIELNIKVENSPYFLKANLTVPPDYPQVTFYSKQIASGLNRKSINHSK